MMMKPLISMCLIAISALTAAAGCSPEGADGQSRAGADGIAHDYRLRTDVVEGRMVFMGVGGVIDGLVNPDLAIVAGENARITLENGDGMMHDLAIPDLHIQTATAVSKDSVVEVMFSAPEAGTYVYYCTVSGHRQAGMEGLLVASAPEA